MLKARSKKLSMLLVLAMLMTMFVGVGTASAATTYSAGEPVNVVAGISNTDFSNNLMIQVTPGAITDSAYVRMELPSDFTVDITGLDKSTTNVGDVLIREISSSTWVPDSSFSTVNGRTFEIYVGKPASYDYDKSSTIALTLKNLYVDSGFTGPVKAKFTAYPGSGLNDGEVTIAQVGSGTVSMSMESVKTITIDASKQEIDKLYLKEDRAGALDPKGVELKLPSGFKWNTATVDSGTIWGTGTLDFNTKDNGRTLIISASTKTTTATYFEINKLQIEVDDSVAKMGDVVARVSGKTSADISELLVAKYGDYGVIVESVDEPTTVIAGKLQQEIGSFRIKEGLKHSLLEGRVVTLEIIGNAKWQPGEYPAINTAKSKNNRMTNSWTPVGSSGKIIRTTIATNGDAGAADMVFHRGEIMVAPTAALDGEIKVKVTGNSGVEETIIALAKVVPPVMGNVDSVANVRIGVADQKLAPIVVTELVDEAIDARTNEPTGVKMVPGLVPDEIDPSKYVWGMVPEVTTTNLNQLALVFPQGIVPKVGTMTVEVLEGDMTIDITSKGVNKRDDGRWVAFVDVTSTSMTPAKVKFDNIYVSLDRTVPEGNVEVGITGSAVNQTLPVFPGDLAVGSVVVAKAITPAPGETLGAGEFVIGSNFYYVGGVKKLMDVAPYIKDSRTYVPMRFLGEILGAEVVWDDAARTVTLTRGDDVVVFTVGSESYTVNGELKDADVAPEIVNDRTMLPARFVAEGFGAIVGWDPGTQTVLIQQ